MTPSSLDEAVSRIRPGMKVAIPPEYCGVAMAATREIICQGIDRLHLAAVPQSGLQADILIGAGLVETLEAALQAGKKGVPFLPLGGILDSDVLAWRRDRKVIDNRFATGDPIIVLPALRPDIAIFHCGMADRAGNLWIGRRREPATMAHASTATTATVETLHDGTFFENEILAAGVLPSTYVDAIVHLPNGTWPLAMPASHLRTGRFSTPPAERRQPDRVLIPGLPIIPSHAGLPEERGPHPSSCAATRGFARGGGRSALSFCLCHCLPDTRTRTRR